QDRSALMDECFGDLGDSGGSCQTDGQGVEPTHGRAGLVRGWGLSGIEGWFPAGGIRGYDHPCKTGEVIFGGGRAAEAFEPMDRLIRPHASMDEMQRGFRFHRSPG